MQQQEKFKFPRTFHFPDSEGVGSDDKIFHDWKETLWGKPVEISIKYDGENTTLYADGSVHARSVDSKNHWSRDDLTSIWKAKGRHALPLGWRIVVENLTATHSIPYDHLYTLYPCIAIIDDSNMVYSPRDLSVLSQIDCALLAEIGIAPVSTFLGDGEGDHPNAFVLNRETFKQISVHFNTFAEYSPHEGFVLRNALPFPLSEYSVNVVKWVREGHVTTDKHWMYAAPRRNIVEMDFPITIKDWLGADY